MENYASVESQETAEVGVPDDSNFSLPSFETYGQPFFERQGLRFRIGPAHVNLSLSLGSEYNDNIFASHVNPTATIVTHLSPYFQLGLGDYHERNEDFLLLDYRPSYDYYVGNSDANHLNQTLDIGGRATFSRYTTAATLSYINSNEPNATQTDRQNYQLLDFSWDNSYYLTAKTFARLTLTAEDQEYENSDHYTTYTASPLLGYVYSPKTTFTFGPYAGIAYIGTSGESGTTGTQTFQGFVVGINYDNLRKLKIQGTAGVQARQFHGSNTNGATNFATPIFNFQFIYTPTAKTDVTLALIRNIQISDILQGLTYTNSEVQFGVTHRLTAHITLNFGLDYQYLEYQGDDPQGRTDEYFSGSPSIGYSFWHDQCQLNVYYRRQQRTSSVDLFSYAVNAYGFQLVFQF